MGRELVVSRRFACANAVAPVNLVSDHSALPIALLVGLSFSLPRLGVSQDFGSGATLHHLDPAIAEVTSGGYWQTDENSGTHRVISVSLGREHRRSLVYLQWLASDAKTGALRDVATVPVDEVNRLALSVVSDLTTLDAKPGETVVRIRVIHEFSEERTVYRIILGRPKEYKVIREGK